METMRALVKESLQGSALRRIPVPACGPGDAVLRVRSAALCGTDLHTHDWSPWAQRASVRLPLVMGHECAGDVIAVGGEVSGLAVGDRVAVETHVPCGECRQCRTGEQHICSNLRLFGIHMDGCFAEAAAVPARCARRLPADVSYDVGAIMEPLGMAVRAVVEVDAAGASLVVLGCAPLLAGGRLQVSPAITHVLPLESWAEGIRTDPRRQRGARVQGHLPPVKVWEA